jgi:cyclophilin family peptidyl-prolyl cis-trans isomerase
MDACMHGTAVEGIPSVCDHIVPPLHRHGSNAKCKQSAFLVVPVVVTVMPSYYTMCAAAMIIITSVAAATSQGLLSVANRGHDTNTGHFSILQAPAPHLNRGYVIFGELVSGWEVCAGLLIAQLTCWHACHVGGCCINSVRNNGSVLRIQ